MATHRLIGVLRLALAQVNARVGDLAYNRQLVARYAAHAADSGADLVAFPEMVITGYPIEDLAFRSSVITESRRAVEELAKDVDPDLVVVVGYLDGEPGTAPRLGAPAGAPRNALAVLHGGRIVARYFKHHLPNYGVFDEYRYFVPGSENLIVRVQGHDVAFAICEDIWQEGGPLAQLRDASLLIVINGSPYEQKKDDTRLALVRERARMLNSAVGYVNLVGGQDELVFDGDSIIVNANGEVIARAPQFHEGLMVVDLELPENTATNPVLISTLHERSRAGVVSGQAERLNDFAEVWQALVTGLRDYVEKNHFNSVVIGLSGGIDSAVVAALAVDALGPDRVYGVSMPSRYSSGHSKDDAFDLAARTGIQFRTVPIEQMVNSFVEDLALTGLAEENIQARVRGMTLMALSNQEGHLVLATGNKSELAVGYSTIYGDAVGGFAPIKDVPKTLVWELARWRNALAVVEGRTPPIPENSISKEPSAELRPGQKDSDSLPNYELLDQILAAYVEGDRAAVEVVAAGFDPELVQRVLRMVDRAEYKRRQYPPGPKISLRAFGRDRRLPITSGWNEGL